MTCPTLSREPAPRRRDPSRLGAKRLPPGGEPALDAILALLPRSAEKVLHLGCGTGWIAAEIARALPRALVVGMEVDANSLGAAKRRARRMGDARNLCFERVLEADRDLEGFHADAVVCAGASPMFASQRATLHAAIDALGPEGHLIDAAYVYQAAVPAELLGAARRRLDGLPVPTSTRSCLERYERAGLVLRSFRRLPSVRFSDAPGATTYRAALSALPGMKPLVDDMVQRRALHNSLSAYRAPVVVSFDRAADARSGPRIVYSQTACDVMDLFSMPVPALSAREIRGLSPERLLAYVGYPDAVPGAAAAIKRAGALLVEMGLATDARVIVSGCFTGMPAFTLARTFGRVLGVDADPEMVRIASALAAHLDSPAQFRAAGDLGAELGPGSAGALVSANEPRGAAMTALLAGAHRALAAGGLLIDLWRAGTAGAPPLSAVIGRVERAGFQLERVERIRASAPDEARARALALHVRRRERARSPTATAEGARALGKMFGRCLSERGPALESEWMFLCAYRKH